MTGPMTAAEASRRLTSGEATPLELVDLCLERIERYEEQVQAWVVVDEDGARRQAEVLGDELKQGFSRGPLHGVPIGIKDIVDVQGLATTAGSSLRVDQIAEQDATLVARLRGAGAVILGKTVTTEFACFDPPPTRNPWNLDHTPGGSSSGSAAAVALGMCLAAIGSQTGGSITRPASFCGIAGLKPTIGRVSVQGVVPISFHLDHPGPMAGCVEDLAMILQAIAGPDPTDPLCAEEAVPEYAAELDRSQPPRLGVIEEFFLTEADAEVRKALEKAVQRLSSQGATIARVSLPRSFVELREHHRRIMAVEAADYHRPWFPSQAGSYGPQVTSLLKEGTKTSATDYAAALLHRRKFQHELLETFADFDALVTPSTVTTAPTRETTGDPRFNSPWSYCGFPTVSIPCSVADDGLPLSLQLAGQRFAEAPLLGVAKWCEKALEFEAHPPLMS